MENSINRVALKSQVIFEILSFLDSNMLIKMQIVNKKYYENLIPIALKYVRSLQPYSNAAIFYEEEGVIYRVTCNIDPDTN